MEDVYFETDIKGNITFVNPSSCKMSGYSEEELLGMPFKKISASDDIEKVMQYFGEIFLTNKTGKPFLWNLVKKNGEQGFFEIVVSLIRDKQGKPIGFRAIGRDVTERKQMEEKLYQEERRFRALVENSSDVIIVMNREGTIAYENPSFEKILGFIPEVKDWRQCIRDCSSG
jgi:PAS domain S-box-containing protein